MNSPGIVKKTVSIILLLLLVSAVRIFPASAPFAQQQFVPDISLILDFSWQWHGNRQKRIKAGPPFFGNPENQDDFRQLSLNYLELAFSSVVDPYLDFFANLVLESGEIEIEEAYVRTRFLPAGLGMKIGRFLSAFGRLNGLHEHQWAFSQAPLAYRQAFGDVLNENGAQLSVVLPFSFFLQAGVEYLLAGNVTSFNGGNDPLDPGNPIITGFIKSSFDLGDFVVLAGASMARGPHEHAMGSTSPQTAWTTVSGLDLTIKKQIDSYRYLSLTGEYLWRLVRPDDPSLEKDAGHGAYLDLLWRFSRRWRCGLRLEKLAARDLGDSSIRPADVSAMIEFNPTEFSRLRLMYQFSRHLLLEDALLSAHRVMLSLNVAVGAHGAHSF